MIWQNESIVWGPEATTLSILAIWILYGFIFFKTSPNPNFDLIGNVVYWPFIVVARIFNSFRNQGH
jgi:hypothetical protein